MNIYVCVKQVPDTETKVQVLDDNSGIKEDSIKWVVNPYDEFAIEEAIKLKSSLNAEKVYAVTVGPQKRVQDSLRVALAMGCDEGVIVDTNDKMDALSTAKAVKAAMEKTGAPGLILTGQSAIDDNSQTFTQQLAALYNVPHAQSVTKIEVEGEKIKTEREIEAGAKEIYEMQGLCVIGANKGLNTPRYPSLPGIMKAKKKPVQTYTTEDLGVSAESYMSYKDYQPPKANEPTKILEGELEDQVNELVDLLKNEAKVL